MIDPSTNCDTKGVPMDKQTSLSADRQRLLELRLKRSAKVPVEPRRIPKRPLGQHPPLSTGQHQMWIIDQMTPGSSAYNIPIAYRIRGELDLRALEDSLNQIIQRHECWRTTFRELDGSPVQEIHPECRIQIRTTDLGHLPAGGRGTELCALASEEAARPFDLRRLPLLRVSLFRLGPDEHVLLINLHHIIFDVWSYAVFARELTAHYAALQSSQPNPLPELPLQYGDYSLWQREKCADAAMVAQLAFWRERLGGDRAPLPVPADRPRPARQSQRGGVRTRELPTTLASKVRDLARTEGVTLFILTLAAFKALLARCSGETDICIGSPIAQRPNVETEALIGYFLNMLALRSDLSGDPDFRELLRRERATVLDAFQHQDVPFEKIVEELHPTRSLSHQPIFQIAFVLMPTDETAPAFAGATAVPFTVPVTTAKFDLTLFIEETRDGMRAMMEFATDQFDPTTADRILESLELLLDGATADPSTPLSHLPILSAMQRARILTEWSGSERPYPQDQTIAARFAECAARTPAAIAVIEDGQRLTYSELETRASRVAHSLQSRGVRAGDFVGLRAERSMGFVVKVLGIAKAGAAYVPLDELEPAARLAAMKAACALILDAEPDGDVPAGPVASAAQADGPACVLFTSGSTGVPKGVIVPHRGITRLVVNNDFAPFQPDDVVAFASNVCFDAATFEIWGALLNGASLVITPRDVLLSPAALAHHLALHRVSVMFLTTSLFNRLAHEAPAMFGRLRILVFGGEAADAASVRLVLANGMPQRLVNGYGPTETTTFAICHSITKIEGSSVPIGRPIANTRVFLLDGTLQPVPVGVAGEIFIGGPGVALGYHAAPALTAEKFLETPFGRLYRTGDLARWLPDGTIEYLRRIDQQVKLRGFRIEPGEIETALQQHPLVRHAAMVVQSEAGTAHSLIAYLVGQSGKRVENAALREFLSHRVPAHMIPSAFVWIDFLPLTPNGKLDTRRLPSPGTAAAPASAETISPRNERERGIAAIWQRALGRNASSVFEDFFTAGGHSLLALRLLGEIRSKFGIEIPARRLFETPTIAGLAEYVSAHTPKTGPAEKFLVSIQRGDSSLRPLFLVAGGWGGEIEFLVYGELSREIDPTRPIWGLKARGAGTGEVPHATVTEMAADYLREVRQIQPHGPYLLAGECVGGICAYEMACQIQEAGEDVALLVLLDAVVPNENHLNNYLDAEARKQAVEAQQFSVRRRISHHLARLSGLPLGGKLGYIFSKAFRRKAPLPPPLQSPAEQHPRGQKDYPITLLRHRLRPYRGTVTLVMDEESARHHGTFGWENISVGRLETRTLPGTHLTYIRENSATAATTIRALLQQITPTLHDVTDTV